MTEAGIKEIFKHTSSKMNQITHVTYIIIIIIIKGKVFYGQEPPNENLLPQNVRSIINYLQ